MESKEMEIIKKVVSALEEMKVKTDKKINDIEEFRGGFTDDEFDFLEILDTLYEETTVLKELIKE